MQNATYKVLTQINKRAAANKRLKARETTDKKE